MNTLSRDLVSVRGFSFWGTGLTFEERFPFYTAFRSELKDLARNLAFREKLIRAAAKSTEVKHAIWMMCKRDELFYVNAFCFTHDPRLADAGKYPVVPFITYEFQDETIWEMVKSIGNHDMLVEKSRDMGASWLCLLVIEHSWHFNDFLSFLLLSAKEDLVDKKGVPKTLFFKLDMILENLPGWLQPTYTRASMKLINNDTGSVIDGEATTGDMGRGGRFTAIMMDEFAAVMQDALAMSATRDATKCRWYNSTPALGRGKNCEFYKLTLKATIKKLWLHWTKHPEKAKGLYYKDGKPRSPWYDEQCDRAASPAEIACELDIDYAGASSQFFATELIDKCRAAAIAPVMRGELLFDATTSLHPKFTPHPEGDWLLWVSPDAKHEWDKEDRFALGVDVSYGTGATNSCISVVNTRTNVKVAECTNPNLPPYRWAGVAVAAARWFNNAFMVWEANGPGREFGNHVIDLGYRDIYYRKNEGKIGKDVSDFPGWYATPQTKGELLGAYKKALVEGVFLNLCDTSLAECLSYVYLPTSGIAHQNSVNTADPSGARANHSDRVIADALANLGMKERPYLTYEEVKPEHEYLSFGWRQEVRKRDRSKSPVWVTVNA